MRPTAVGLTCPHCRRAITPRSVSLVEAGRLLGVSRHTVYNYLASGLLQRQRIGPSQRVTLASIYRLLIDHDYKGRHVEHTDAQV